MTTNYIKLSRGRRDSFFFFGDDEASAQVAYDAYSVASVTEPLAFASVFKRPVARGPWSVIPVIGGPSGAEAWRS